MQVDCMYLGEILPSMIASAYLIIYGAICLLLLFMLVIFLRKLLVNSLRLRTWVGLTDKRKAFTLLCQGTLIRIYVSLLIFAVN